MKDREAILRIAMLVVDANDVNGAPTTDSNRIGPVVHPAIDNLLEGLRDRNDVEVHVLYGKRHPQHGEERICGTLHYHPISYKPLPIPGIGGPYLGRLIALLGAIKRLRPDLVHAQGTERESGLAAVFARKPSLLTLHGNFREIARVMGCKRFDYLWINAKLETFICRKVDGILSISTYTRDLVSKLNRRIWVLPNAVASQFFNVINQPAPGKIVCVAGIGARKNQIEFLRACDQVAGEESSFRLEFWGPAEAASTYFQEFQRALEERPWARYRGAAAPEKIPEILKDADLLALPSKEDNCPVVILEAMAAGIPVVASQIGGIPDLVEDGRTGYTEPPDQMPELAIRASEVIRDRALRDRLAALAREAARRRFTPAAIADAHVEIYREILN